MKYVCDVCGWEYDEEQGYPEAASPRAPSGRTFPTTSFARCVWSARMSFLKLK